MVTQKQETESEPEAWNSPYKYLLISRTVCVSTAERDYKTRDLWIRALGSQHKLTRKAYLAPSWAWNEFNDSQAQGWNQARGKRSRLQGSAPTRNLGQNFQNVFRLGKTGKWSKARSQLFPSKPG